MAPPVTVDDTVVYTPRNLFFDKNVVLTLLDGSQIEVWGNFFVNGNPLATIGSLPVATNAEAVAGTDNTKVMTPLRTKESIVANAPGGSGAVGSVNGKTGVVVLNQDEVLDGSSFKQYSLTEKNKLAGIATGATANATDAQLRDRSTHTGTQAESTVTNLVSDLAAKVNNTGNETIAGTKTFSSDILVPDEAYGVAWDTSLEVPTKNALYDKIETISTTVITASGHFTYTYNSTLTEPPIGNQLRLNNATQSAATRLWIMETTFDGLDVSLGLAKILSGHYIYIQDYDDANKWIKYTVTADGVDDGTYYDFTVVYHSGPGGIPAGKVEIQHISPGATAVIRTINTYSGTSLTGVIGDIGAYIRCTGTNPSYTIPPNSSVAYPIGTQIDGIGTATAMTLVQGSGVTINKARTLVTLGANSGWTAIKVATDTWDVHGDFV